MKVELEPISPVHVSVVEPKIESTFSIVLLIVLVEQLIWGTLVAVLPFHLKSLGGNAQHLGWLMAAGLATQPLTDPIWGHVSDRFGRRPVILINLFANTLSLAVIAFAPSLAWLFIGRFVGGIFGANTSLAYTYAADVSYEHERAKKMSLITNSLTLGFVVGPLLAALLSYSSYVLPLVVCAVISLLTTFFAFWKLKEAPPSLEMMVSRGNSWKFDRKAIQKSIGNGRFQSAVIIGGLVAFAFSLLPVTFALSLHAKLGLDAPQTAKALVVFGLAGLLARFEPLWKALQRWDEMKTAAFGAVACGIGFVIFGASNHWAPILFALILIGFGQAFPGTALASLVSKASSSDLRGVTMSIYRSIGTLIRALGFAVAGWAFEANGPGFCLFLGGVVFIAAAALCQAVSGRLSGLRT